MDLAPMNIGEPGIGNGARLGVGMVAAAVGAMLPPQDTVLRGSQATQSLAADVMNEVVQVAVEDTVQSGGASGGSKVLEVVGVQAVGVLLPMAATAIRSTCGRRNDVQDVHTPPAPRKPLQTPELSP